RFVELFLKKGAPVGVDENDYSEQTPLHQVYAPQIIMMLIKAGADVNKQDKYKNSPLHYAAENDELAAAEILLESGADPFSKGGEWIDIESDSLPFDHAKSQKMRNLLKSYMKNKKKRR
ncbi:MAG: ankyrin repeat domain-containing protein, partial [Proteobacteria bacterium]|nr:ankyrin repeat domain-containing protein [Pseudomonadota bacterium]MBU1581574.1 ankyrin repeat domain-containing protein [Pseudomonadota bacterium]